MSIQIVEVRIPFSNIVAVDAALGNTIGRAVITSLTPPSNTSVLWYDPSDGTISVWNGSVWVTDGSIYSIPDGALTFGGDILTFSGDTLTFQAA